MKSALAAGIDRLDSKRVVPKVSVGLLGKGKGADPRVLANGEKSVLVASPRPEHGPKDPLGAAGLVKEGHHCYRMAAIERPTGTPTRLMCVVHRHHGVVDPGGQGLPEPGHRLPRQLSGGKRYVVVAQRKAREHDA